MRSNLWKTIVNAVMVASLLLIGGCSSSPLDNPDADVVLQVSGIEAPPVTVQDNAGSCIATIPPWTIEFINVPKSAGAIVSPFNDITVRGMTATYVWQDVVVSGPITTSLVVIGAPATVPADSTGDVIFFPLLGQHFNSSMLSTTANMTINVDAVTAIGEQVGLTFNAQLFIEACAGGTP